MTSISDVNEASIGGVVVVVVVLLQASEDDPQKHLGCTWKADELVTVGAWV